MTPSPEAVSRREFEEVVERLDEKEELIEELENRLEKYPSDPSKRRVLEVGAGSLIGLSAGSLLGGLDTRDVSPRDLEQMIDSLSIEDISPVGTAAAAAADSPSPDLDFGGVGGVKNATVLQGEQLFTSSRYAEVVIRHDGTSFYVDGPTDEEVASSTDLSTALNNAISQYGKTRITYNVVWNGNLGDEETSSTIDFTGAEDAVLDLRGSYITFSTSGSPGIDITNGSPCAVLFSRLNGKASALRPNVGILSGDQVGGGEIRKIIGDVIQGEFTEAGVYVQGRERTLVQTSINNEYASSGYALALSSNDALGIGSSEAGALSTPSTVAKTWVRNGLLFAAGDSTVFLEGHLVNSSFRDMDIKAAVDFVEVDVSIQDAESLTFDNCRFRVEADKDGRGFVVDDGLNGYGLRNLTLRGVDANLANGAGTSQPFIETLNSAYVENLSIGRGCEIVSDSGISADIRESELDLTNCSGLGSVSLTGSSKAVILKPFSVIDAYLSANKTKSTGYDIEFDSENRDDLDEMNTSTGVFTTTEQGMYLVSAGMGLNSAASGDVIKVLLVKNASTATTLDRRVASDGYPVLQGSDIVSLSAGDTVKIRGTWDTGTTETVVGSEDLTYVAIRKVA